MFRCCSVGSQTDTDFERLEYAQDELISPSTSGHSASSIDDIIKQLEEAESLHSQADLLHYLHCTVYVSYFILFIENIFIQDNLFDFR